MNVFQLVLYIIETALEVVKGYVGGKRVENSEALVRIVRAGYQAYRVETGLDLDPAKIRPFEPLA